MLSFVDKVVAVTGGTSGIGRATAVAFARAGAKVVVAGRREKEGEQTVQLMREAGGAGMFVRTDVSREADVAALIDTTVATFGRLDYAFNNAGREANAGIIDGTEEDFDAVVGTNTKGVFFCLKHEIRHMRTTGGGAIVNTISVSGMTPTGLHHCNAGATGTLLKERGLAIVALELGLVLHPDQCLGRLPHS